eukprot:m.124540 g.124540  ORF g.124540 m.124540 type:complete len:1410 (+) comp16622_c0_seq4:1871-6100(+)
MAARPGDTRPGDKRKRQARSNTAAMGDEEEDPREVMRRKRLARLTKKPAAAGSGHPPTAEPAQAPAQAPTPSPAQAPTSSSATPATPTEAPTAAQAPPPSTAGTDDDGTSVAADAISTDGQTAADAPSEGQADGDSTPAPALPEINAGVAVANASLRRAIQNAIGNTPPLVMVGPSHARILLTPSIAPQAPGSDDGATTSTPTLGDGNKSQADPDSSDAQAQPEATATATAETAADPKLSKGEEGNIEEAEAEEAKAAKGSAGVAEGAQGQDKGQTEEPQPSGTASETAVTLTAEELARELVARAEHAKQELVRYKREMEEKRVQEAERQRQRDKELRERMRKRREEQQAELRKKKEQKEQEQKQQQQHEEEKACTTVPMDTSPDKAADKAVVKAADKATLAAPASKNPAVATAPQTPAPTSIVSQTGSGLMAQTPGLTPGQTPDTIAAHKPADERRVVEWVHDYVVKVFQVSLLKTAEELEADNAKLVTMTDWRGVSQKIDTKSVAFFRDIEKSLPEDHTAESLFNELLHVRLSSTELPEGLPRSISYLVITYQRAYDESKHISQKSRLYPVSDAAMEIITNYTVTCLQVPEMYSDGTDVHDFIFDKLVKQEFPPDLLQRIFARCGDDKGMVKELLGPVLERLSQAARKACVIEDAWPLISLFDQLSRFPAFCALVLEHEEWVPEESVSTGRQFECDTLVAPLLRASSLPETADVSRIGYPVFEGEHLFPADGQQRAARTTLRTQLNLIRTNLHEAFRNLLRVKDHRDDVLRFFCTALLLNQRRAQLRARRERLATDGFMLNLSALLLRLCRPFIKFDKPNFDKIDPMFLCNRKEKLDTSQETRLSCGGDEVEQWREAHKSYFDERPPNFVTHAFFYTLHSLHVGLIPALQKFTNEWMSTGVQLVQAVRMAEQVNDPRVDYLRDQQKRYDAHTRCYEAELGDPSALKEALEFYCYAAYFLLNVASKGQAELPESPPIEFAVLPEYIVEDMCELLIYLSRFSDEVIESCLVTAHLGHFILSFIGNKAFITNPYLRGKLVEVVALFSPGRRERGSKFFDILRSDARAVRFLGPALMQFYVDAEETDFYLKLSMRSNAQVILQDLWKAPSSRAGIVEATRDKGFLRFIMFLLNDTTYLLDEVREVLEKIQGFKAQQREPMFSASSTSGRELAGELSHAENQARGLLRLVSETLNMFEYITEEVVEPFLSCEVVNRLAAMLDYNVKVLVDTKSSTVVASEAEQYGYKPVEILRSLVNIYLHVSRVDHHGASKQNSSFVEAIAADDRSYEKEIFDRTAHVLQLREFQTDVVRAFQNLADSVAKAADARQCEDEELGDVPDKYLDQIMYEIMTDPVQLPESKCVVDRQTIAAHLLSDPHDPFNRQPLTMDDIVEMPELKAEIEAFKKSKRSSKA